MKPTLAQRFTSSCPTGGLPNLASTPTRRLSVVLLLALSLIAPGGPERLGAQGKKEPKSYLVVTPDAATLEVGQQSQLRAAVLDPVGFDLIPRKVTWHSSDPSIALVNSTGLVTAMAAGTVTIRAKSGPAMGTAAITVNGVVVPPPNTAPIVTITDPADGVSFPEGIPITFMGTAQDAQDGNLSNGIAWTISAANYPAAVQTPLGTGAAVSANPLARGSYLVTAGVADSRGLAGVAQVGITVGCSFVLEIQPAEGLKIPQALQLDAQGSYDTCGRPLQYYWSCRNTIDPMTCPEFLPAANANGNNTPTRRWASRNLT